MNEMERKLLEAMAGEGFGDRTHGLQGLAAGGMAAVNGAEVAVKIL